MARSPWSAVGTPVLAAPIVFILIIENTMTSAVTQLKTADDLKSLLANHYQKQINNYFGDDKKALRFLSGVIAAVQRNPKLLECQPASVVNSFMTMAQLELMPSDVSGEAFVIPYSNSKKDGNNWIKVMEAQFQLGYQGLVTLMYRAGCKSIVAEVVREHDKFSYVNGVITHEPDVFSDDRGKAKGAYCIVTLSTGGVVAKVMSAKEILTIAQSFSKSFSKDSSPWHEANDPQLWQWKKTVLKQTAKLVPKNEKLIHAIAADNQDSIIGDRLEAAKEEAKSLTMGAIATKPYDDNQTGTEAAASKTPQPTESVQTGNAAPAGSAQ